MQEIPSYIDFLLIATAIISLVWFYIASRSKIFVILALAWGILQSVLAANEFYLATDKMPPRIMLFGIVPTFFMILLVFLSPTGRSFIDRINLKTLTYFHSIRVAVELVLAMLVYQQVVSVYMSYEGTNFDILSGISAPIIAYLVFRSQKHHYKLLLWWNVIALLLLLNVVITAVFAFPSPFQLLAFDQPNLAILHFPFALIPTLIVPMVIFAHLVAFRQIRNGLKTSRDGS